MAYQEIVLLGQVIKVCCCGECKHSWLAEGEKPKRCAKCKSSYWDSGEGITEPIKVEVLPPEVKEETSRAVVKTEDEISEVIIQAPVKSGMHDWRFCKCAQCSITRKKMGMK